MIRFLAILFFAILMLGCMYLSFTYYLEGSKVSAMFMAFVTGMVGVMSTITMEILNRIATRQKEEREYWRKP